MVLLREPIAIAQAEEHTDGGTVTVVLVGADSESLVFCLDSRMVPLDTGPCGRVTPLCEHTFLRIYVNAGYPTDPGAELVPYGGQVEHDIAATVRSAIITKYGDTTIEAALAHCATLPSDPTVILRGAHQTAEQCSAEAHTIMGLLHWLGQRCDLPRQAPN